MSMTNDNIGPLAAEKATAEAALAAEKKAQDVNAKVAIPNINTPIPVASATKPMLNAAQLKEAAEQMAALEPAISVEEIPEAHIASGFRMNIPGVKTPPGATDGVDLNSLDPYGATAREFQDEIEAEEAQAAQVLSQANKTQLQSSGKAIRELIEDDAYDLEIPLYAGVAFNPNLLKVDLIDPNYVARWGNTNNIRQTMLVSQGFSFCSEKDIKNLEQLSMFKDSIGHFVWADLVAMRIRKDIYYAGLRRAYLKSLHATNKSKAAKAGAAFAKGDLNRALTGPERSYMVNQAKQDKEIYSPVVGV